MVRFLFINTKRSHYRFFSSAIDLTRASISEVALQLQSGALSAEELAAWSIEKSDKVNHSLNCIAGEQWKDRAMVAAKEAGERIRCGKRRGILDGIPLTIKDNFCVKGLPTTAASKILGDWRPPFRFF
jgi:aspartyl-tRNA(Asn)/glutamyl-tRNA(Gln) amidotransferase subunit A